MEAQKSALPAMRRRGLENIFEAPAKPSGKHGIKPIPKREKDKNKISKSFFKKLSVSGFFLRIIKMEGRKIDK